VLGNLKLLQEEPEVRYNKTESHQSQAGTHPCQKSSLGSQIVAIRRSYLLSVRPFQRLPNNDSKQATRA